MSDRMRRRRQLMADKGFQVVEVIMSKEILSKFETLASLHGLSRSKYISSLFYSYYGGDEFEDFYRTSIRDFENKKKTLLDKYSPEFTDNTLS